MTKMTKALLAVGAAAVGTGCAYVGGKAAVQRKLLSTTRQLKLQLAEENNLTEAEVSEVEVQRPWYSLNAGDWTYIVKLTDYDTPLQFRLRDGYFIPALPEPGAD